MKRERMSLKGFIRFLLEKCASGVRFCQAGGGKSGVFLLP